MCDKIVSKELLGRFKTQEMCNKAFDTCLPALKIAPDCFVTSNVIEKT